MPKSTPKPAVVNTVEAVREVIYKNLSVMKCLGDSAITEEQMMEFLGWEEVETKDESVLFTDMWGKHIRCTNNTHNRPFDMATALGYAQEVLSRNWADSRNTRPDDPEPMSINGETIIINRYADVDSGQHRLAGGVFACQIWAGAKPQGRDQSAHWKELWPEKPTMEALMVLGVSGNPRVTRTLDNVRPRGFSDVLFAEGQFAVVTDSKGKSKPLSPGDREKLCKMAANALKLLWDRTGYADKKGFNAYSPKMTHSVGLDFMANHPTLRKCVQHVFAENKGGAIAKYMSPGYASAVLYLQTTSDSEGDDYRTADPPQEGGLLSVKAWKKACEFWAYLCKDPSFEVVRNARRPIIGDRGKRTGFVFSSSGLNGEAQGGSNDERLAVLAKAWQLFKAGEPLSEEGVEAKYDRDLADDGTVMTVWLDESPEFGGIDLGAKRKEHTKTAEEGDESGEGEGEDAGNDPELDKEEIEAAKEVEARRKRDAELEARVEAKKAAKATKHEPPKTALSDELAKIHDDNPDQVVVSYGSGSYSAWGEDANILAAALGLKAIPRPDGLRRVNFLAAAMPENLAKLTELGHAVINWGKDEAGNAAVTPLTVDTLGPKGEPPVKTKPSSTPGTNGTAPAGKPKRSTPSQRAAKRAAGAAE